MTVNEVTRDLKMTIKRENVKNVLQRAKNRKTLTSRLRLNVNILCHFNKRHGYVSLWTIKKRVYMYF